MGKFFLMVFMSLCMCSSMKAEDDGSVPSHEITFSRNVKSGKETVHTSGPKTRSIIYAQVYASILGNTLTVDLSAFSSTDVQISVTDMADSTQVYDEIHSGSSEVEIVLENLSVGTIYQIDVETEDIIFTGEFVFR